MAKTTMQPWLDCFDLLRKYEHFGYLEVHHKEHEAYITRPALFALSGYPDDADRLGDTSPSATERRMAGIGQCCRHIRAFAAYEAQEGAAYLAEDFALHVVKESGKHDMLFTLHLSRQRVWWRLWRKSDRIKLISYV